MFLVLSGLALNICSQLAWQSRKLKLTTFAAEIEKNKMLIRAYTAPRQSDVWVIMLIGIRIFNLTFNKWELLIVFNKYRKWTEISLNSNYSINAKSHWSSWQWSDKNPLSLSLSVSLSLSPHATSFKTNFNNFLHFSCQVLQTIDNYEKYQFTFKALLESRVYTEI